MFPVVGKHGKRRSCQSKEATANEWSDSITTPIIRRNDAGRCVVDAAAPGVSRIVDLYRLLDLGGISGNALFFRQLYFSILLTGNFRGLAAQLVWTETNLVAGLVIIFSGPAHPVRAGRVPADLVLLERRLLQGLWGRPGHLYRGLGAQNLS